MRLRGVLIILAFVAACGGGPSRGANSSADTSVPAAQAPATPPDTQMTRTPAVTITTDRRSYRAGDPVELRVVNQTASSYTYNPCTRIVERQAGSSWTPVEEDRICTMIAHVLDPNATRVERTELGEQLTPGTYRLLVQFTGDDASPGAKAVLAYSQPISVSP